MVLTSSMTCLETSDPKTMVALTTRMPLAEVTLRVIFWAVTPSEFARLLRYASWSNPPIVSGELMVTSNWTAGR